MASTLARHRGLLGGGVHLINIPIVARADQQQIALENHRINHGVFPEDFSDEAARHRSCRSHSPRLPALRRGLIREYWPGHWRRRRSLGCRLRRCWILSRAGLFAGGVATTSAGIIPASAGSSPPSVARIPIIFGPSEGLIRIECPLGIGCGFAGIRVGDRRRLRWGGTGLAGIGGDVRSIRADRVLFRLLRLRRCRLLIAYFARRRVQIPRSSSASAVISDSPAL